MKVRAKDVLGREESKRSLKAPKEWWDKTMADVKKTPKYKDYGEERLGAIVGSIWWGLSDSERKEIRNRYGKEYGEAK